VIGLPVAAVTTRLVRPLLNAPATSLVVAGALDVKVATAATAMAVSLFMIKVPVRTEAKLDTSRGGRSITRF